MSANTYKVLVADGLAKPGQEILKKTEGLEMVEQKGLSPDELLEVIGDYHGIIIRSATKITPEVLDRADNLQAVIRAGVGVDNIDLKAAAHKGVIVMNTPGGNISSTAEHTMALMISLVRNIPQADTALRNNAETVDPSACTQLEGKTLGIIGMGRVGCGVAQRARALGMKLMGYDPFITPEQARNLNVRPAKVDEIIEEADFITVHTPMTPETRGMISTKEFAKMKPTAMLINCARGGIIDEDALLEALNNGQVAGAALDVYEQEPPKNQQLIQHPHMVVTPHLGASTEEAQVAVGVEAAEQMADALLKQEIRNPVNIPRTDSREIEILAPFLKLAEQMGRFQSQRVSGQLLEVQVHYQGEVAEHSVELISSSLLVGLLDQMLEQHVNRINAPLLAKERGIILSEHTSTDASPYLSRIIVTVTTEDGTHSLSGTVVGKNEPRIVGVDDIRVEIFMQGTILLTSVQDRPGLLGEMGQITATEGINIVAMTFGTKEDGKEAFSVLNLEKTPTRAALEKIRQIASVTSCKVIDLN